MSFAQVFDTVWQQFQKLSSPTKSTGLTMEDFNMAGRSEFSSPQVHWRACIFSSTQRLSALDGRTAD